MSPLSLRRRLDRSRGILALWLIVGLGALVAVHHSDLMPMEHGHDGGMSSEAGVAMICLGVLAVGLAAAPVLGAVRRLRRRECSTAAPIFLGRPLPAPPPLSRAGPEHSQVFRL